jgi:hypothetical protein
VSAGESGGGEQLGGPPAERLREQLERELGEVPAETPSEPQEGEAPPSEDADERKEGDEGQL